MIELSHIKYIIVRYEESLLKSFLLTVAHKTKYKLPVIVSQRGWNINKLHFVYFFIHPLRSTILFFFFFFYPFAAKDNYLNDSVVNIITIILSKANSVFNIFYHFRKESFNCYFLLFHRYTFNTFIYCRSYQGGILIFLFFFFCTGKAL